ncbi:MAG: MoxR family ATPase [Chromatiaceae bacterium]|nr:MoxR family ATPase [Chromatiaceae bacterium]
MSSEQLPLFKPGASHWRITDEQARASFGELGDGKVYVHDPKTVFAVQVAQKTGRPLLLQGPAGSGKSSLAPFVANELGCRFYSYAVNARTQARDLMWDFDALGRLNDANIAASVEAARVKVVNLHNYLTPGVLWWAFDAKNAGLRGATDAAGLQIEPCRDPATIDPNDPDKLIEYRQPGAVVLIDEIDKADPDVPNNLLEAFGSRRFTVAETGTRVVEQRPYPLIFITTNKERELPNAFLRRCIVLELRHKTPEELVRIAKAQLEGTGSAAYLPVAQKIAQLREEAQARDLREPSTAEYLDALVACNELGVSPNGETEDERERWRHLVDIGMRKLGDTENGRNTRKTR